MHYSFSSNYYQFKDNIRNINLVIEDRIRNLRRILEYHIDLFRASLSNNRRWLVQSLD